MRVESALGRLTDMAIVFSAFSGFRSIVERLADVRAEGAKLPLVTQLGLCFILCRRDEHIWLVLDMHDRRL